MNSFQQLLASNPDEPTIQSYLENHPQSLVANKHILGNVVVRKLPLGRDLVTDFSYVEPQSGRAYLHMIEIESSTKEIFTKEDQFTEKFNHALQQVVDWMQWVERNRQGVIDLLEPLRAPTNAAIVMYTARGHLLFGRRRDISNVRRNERWAAIKTANPLITIRTLDGFEESNRSFFDDGNPMNRRTAKYEQRNYTNVYP